MRTLSDAIQHCLEIAASGKCSPECSADHLQLAGWLQELKDYRQGFAAVAATLKENQIERKRKGYNP